MSNVFHLIRGDTFPSVNINIPTPIGDSIYLVRSHLRDRFGNLLAELNVEALGQDEFEISAIPYTITETFPVGNHVFDIEVTTYDGVRTTVCSGEIIVTPDVTRD